MKNVNKIGYNNLILFIRKTYSAWLK